MNAIYIKENNELNYFLFAMNKNIENNEECYFSDIQTIKSDAFKNVKNLERIYFNEKLQKIEKNAFKDNISLEVYSCCNIEKCKENNNKNLELNDIIADKTADKTADETADKQKKNFTVEAFSFSGCEKLNTVVFPKCSKLTIEKFAFENCSSLRTIVVLAKEISFTDNPFEDCPSDLVFICNKDSTVERFARENGYGIVYVK